jgi:hypothetical protein
MRLGASLRWLGYPSGFSPTLADSLPFWTKIFWPSSERTKSINSFAAFGLQLRLIRRSRASGVLGQQRRSETAWSFSAVSSPNLRALALSRGAKESFEIAVSLFTRTMGGLGFRRVGLWIARWSQRLPCYLRDTNYTQRKSFTGSGDGAANRVGKVS